MISVIDYNGGNLFSVLKALDALGAQTTVLTAPEQYRGGKLLIPGVGAFGDAMHHLRRTGFDAFLREQVQAGTPLLGICLGMQLLFNASEEAPGESGLQLLPGEVKRFRGGLNVPHMGWNQIEPKPERRILAGVQSGDYVYFAHSFYVSAAGQPFEAATCDYGQTFVAVVEQENLFAVQFHPEKSHRVGMRILKNFIEL